MGGMRLETDESERSQHETILAGGTAGQRPGGGNELEVFVGTGGRQCLE